MRGINSKVVLVTVIVSPRRGGGWETTGKKMSILVRLTPLDLDVVVQAS